MCLTSTLKNTMKTALNQESYLTNVLDINTVNNSDDDENESDLLTPLLQKNLPARQNQNIVDQVSNGQNVSLRPIKIILYLTDVFLSVFVFSPIIVIYWYCTWTFLDDYFLKDEKYLSNLLSLGIGLGIILIGYLTQDHMQICYERLKRLARVGSVLRFLMRFIYFYIVTFAYIFQWRAIWNLYVMLISDDLNIQLSLAFVALVYFCLTRSTRALLCNPYLLYSDDTEQFFVTQYERFKINWLRSNWIQNLVNFFMIEVVECFVMNLIWFGVQNYFDSIIYPNDWFWRLLITFLVSHCACALILFVQTVIFKIFRRFQLVPRLIGEDLMNTLMIVTTILYWKFYWDLCDYFIRNQPYIFYLYLAGHLVTFAITIICNVTGDIVGPDPLFYDGEAQITRAYFEVNFASGLFQNYLQNPNEGQTSQEEFLINPNV